MPDMPQVRVSHDGKQFAILVEPGSHEPWYLIEAYPGCCSKRGVGTDEDVADWTPLVDVAPLIEEWQIAAADRRATSQHGQAKAYDECILNLRQLLEVDW